MPVLAWVGARLMEPSTWAGMALVVNGIQQALTTNDWKIAAAQVVGGLLASGMAEGPKKV